MWNYVSSSWFERLRISDGKFVNHTTEMILWSMILKLNMQAVGISSRVTGTTSFDPIHVSFLGMRLIIDWRVFSLSFWCPIWWNKSSKSLLPKVHALSFISNNPKVQKSDPNAICAVVCTREIVGFNETIRNWHEEWCFTRSSRGIGIQFSTSNNTTSLNDHWLVYRHCAKLRNWGKVEKVHLPYKQTTPLSPISPLFVCNFSAQLWQCWKR